MVRTGVTYGSHSHHHPGPSPIGVLVLQILSEGLWEGQGACWSPGVMIACSVLVALEAAQDQFASLSGLDSSLPPALSGAPGLLGKRQVVRSVGAACPLQQPTHVGSLSDASLAAGQLGLWARWAPRGFRSRFEMCLLCAAGLEITNMAVDHLA